MITYRHKLDVVPASEHPELWLSQNDENYQMIFDLYARTGDFTIEAGTTAAIHGTKPDGSSYSAPASLSGKTVTVEGDAEMTSAKGRGVFEICLTHGGRELHTNNIIINFERAALENT